MGYRHQVISDTMVMKKDELPKWFTDKYDGLIDFDRDYWASYTELKRYSALEDFNKDIQKVLIEDGKKDSVRLIYFADESEESSPDVIHTHITTEFIKEITPDCWCDNWRD